MLVISGWGDIIAGTGTHRFYVELVPHLYQTLLGEGGDVRDCDHDGPADPLTAHALGIRFDGLHTHLLVLRVENEDLLIKRWLRPYKIPAGGRLEI